MKKQYIIATGFAAACLFTAAYAPANATNIVFQNDFEAPTGFVTGSYTDVSQQAVNSLYGSTFGQSYTVETLRIAGSSLYTDASGIGGNYALGMLSNVQDDRLWLTFDAAGLDFVNVGLDISSIDLQGPVAPFTNNASAPEFKFSLFDVGSNNLLSSSTFSGTASDQFEFDWTNHILALSTVGATGDVRLELDLLNGGYAAFDNLIITSSDERGDIGQGPDRVPEPAVLGLFGIGLAGIGMARKKYLRRA